MDENSRKVNNFLTALKGLIIGGTMLVPGVSGGSMAMILGIYDRLISSVSSFMKNKKENLVFLVIFSLGGILGILYCFLGLMLAEKRSVSFWKKHIDSCCIIAFFQSLCLEEKENRFRGISPGEAAMRRKS